MDNLFDLWNAQMQMGLGVMAGFTSAAVQAWGPAARQVAQPQPAPMHEVPDPAFGIESIHIGNEEVPVHVDCTNISPFARVWSFRVDRPRAPSLLEVHPNSGKRVSILKTRIRTNLVARDVHALEIIPPDYVSREYGEFGMSENAHLVAAVKGRAEFKDIETISGASQGAMMTILGGALMFTHPDTCNGRLPKNLIAGGGPHHTHANPERVRDLDKFYWASFDVPLPPFVEPLYTDVPHGLVNGKAYPGAGRRIVTGERMARCMSELSKKEKLLGVPVELQALTAQSVRDTLWQNYFLNEMASGVWTLRDGTKARLEAIKARTLVIDFWGDKIVIPAESRALKELLLQAEEYVSHSTAGGHYDLFGPNYVTRVAPAVSRFLNTPGYH